MPDIIQRKVVFTPTTVQPKKKAHNVVDVPEEKITPVEEETVEESSENNVIVTEINEEPTVEMPEDTVTTSIDTPEVAIECNEAEPSEEESTFEEETTEEESEEDIDYDSIKASDKNIKGAFDGYDLTDEEALQMLTIMREYQENRSVKGIYNRLPKSMQNMINGMIAGQAIPKGQTIGTLRNDAVATVLDMMLNDAKYSQSLDDYQKEMNDAMDELNKGYNKIFRDAIDETFEKIDEIRAEDPEQAERIERVKKAFNAAEDFSGLMDLLSHITANKLNKLAGKFDKECYSFNKRINSTSVKIPPIEDIGKPIRTYLPKDEYSDEDITKFLALVCWYCRSIDVNLNISHLAYIYKFINNIYSYSFTDPKLDEHGTKLFEGIKAVIDKIKSL